MLFFILTFTCEVTMVGAGAPEVTVRSLDGKEQNGKWCDWTRDAIVLREVNAETAEKKIPLVGLEQIVFSGSPALASESLEDGFRIRLVDRSDLLAKSFLLSGDAAEVVWATGKSQRIPLALIRSVYQTVADDRVREEWNRLVDKPRGRDRLAVRKGKAIDYVEGVISGVTTDYVDFVLDGESIPVKWSKIAGLLFADRPDVPSNPAKCQLLIRGGSRIPVAAWTSTSQDVTVKIPCGLSLVIPLDQLQSIDFSEDKVIYLSQLTPLVTEFSPYLAAGKLSPLLQRFYGPRQDSPADVSRGDRDRRLEIVTIPAEAGSSEKVVPAPIESYTRGLSLRSKSRLVYPLPAEARRFEARVGIDAGSAQLGNVHLTVLGDGRVLFEEEISGQTGPRDVSVSVAGLRQLELIVDYGKNQDAGDRLNLCNARIVK